VKPGQDVDDTDAKADDYPTDQVRLYTEGKHVFSLVPEIINVEF
jgi:hypothetical protein